METWFGLEILKLRSCKLKPAKAGFFFGLKFVRIGDFPGYRLLGLNYQFSVRKLFKELVGG